jgi:cytochrome P450
MSNNQYKKPVRIQPLQVLKFLKDVFSALSSSPQRHPELFVSGLQGLKKVYIINHPGLAQHILQKNYTNYVKGDGYKVVARLLGKGLVTNDGENWHKQRTLIQPAFHRGTLKKISEIVTSSTNAVLDSWKNKEGQSINFTQEMAGLTIDIVAKSLFTTDVTPRQIQTIWHNVNYLNESSDKILRNPLPMPWFVPTPEHLKMRKAIAELDDLMYGIINRRKTEKNPPLDLLQMLLEARYENSDQGMSDQQIRDEVMTIFLAGHETTVNALSWTWYLVKQHAGVEKLLREESETLALNRDPVFEELPGMPYGRNVGSADYVQVVCLSEKNWDSNSVCIQIFSKVKPSC